MFPHGTARAVVLVAGLALTIAAQAAVQFVNLTNDNPPPTELGGLAMQVFDVVPQAALGVGAFVSTIPGSPVPGDLTVAPQVRKFTMPDIWQAAWSNGYAGPIFFSGEGVRTSTLTLPAGATAFYFYAQPNRYDGSFGVTATTDSGTTSGPILVTPVIAPLVYTAGGFGFYVDTPGETITSITITVPNSVNGFGLAQFGISLQVPGPPPPPPTVTAVPTLDQWSLLLLGMATAGIAARRLRRR